jgi:hypothetical protein
MVKLTRIEKAQQKQKLKAARELENCFAANGNKGRRPSSKAPKKGAKGGARLSDHGADLHYSQNKNGFSTARVNSQQSLVSLLKSYPWFPHTSSRRATNLVQRHTGIRGTREGLFMSEERGAELFRALHAIIDVVTNLNLRDLEAKAKASSSSTEEGTSAKASARGKAKDPNPN